MTRRLGKARKKSGGGPDIPDSGCLDAAAFDELLVVALVIVVVIAVLIWGPAVVAFLLDILLIVLFTALALTVAVIRLLFRRPWRVVALRSWDEVWVWHQTGLGDARQLVREIRAGIATGQGPATIAADRLDPASPLTLGLNTPRRRDHPLFQWVSRLLVAAGVVALAVAISASRSGG